MKDTSKKTDELNNIRPISISNCFAQILEKLILIRSPGLRTSHKNQFGFKPKTSCNHALFTLKETILHYTENRTGIKVASLDAEKAFDKVWRDALFHKLIKKLDGSMWYILKVYYDSSYGVLDLGDGVLSELFPIKIGVKQGGILSPTLFHAFIDDLIYECTNLNVGAHIKKINVSIIVYADDILLLSSVDAHLQLLLNICDSYSYLWRIKFNASKSNIVEFDIQFFNNSSFVLNGKNIYVVDSFKYLGVLIDRWLNFNANTIEKFGSVQKAVFSLSFLGLSPNSISPHLQSFIFKTFCLSLFTYGLETTVLNKETIDYLNICQNNLLRQIIGLHKSCHMSNILKSLKIFKFEDLYAFTKLSFLKSIKQNEITSNIFSLICNTKRNKNSKSFIQDIRLLEGRFGLSIGMIYLDPLKYKLLLKKNFDIKSGITDSVDTCLANFKSNTFKNILNNLIKPDFIRQDEEFQELLQYIIITNEH